MNISILNSLPIFLDGGNQIVFLRDIPKIAAVIDQTEILEDV
jgi:hypothetical protein